MRAACFLLSTTLLACGVADSASLAEVPVLDSVSTIREQTVGVPSANGGAYRGIALGSADIRGDLMDLVGDIEVVLASDDRRAGSTSYAERARGACPQGA